MKPDGDPSPPRRLGEILKAGETYLRGRGIEFPRLACEWLAARLLNLPRLELYPRYDQALSSRELAAMRRGLKRVGRHEPVQYVLGEWDFRGHGFRVDRRALVPRPETEELVQRVLDCAPLWAETKAPRIVDVGTGSGCIVISLALEKARGRYLAVDTSAAALALARENADRHGVGSRIRFLHGELGDSIRPGAVEAVVANLPYVSTDEMAELPSVVREHEPFEALHGGGDGMEVIRRVARDALLCLGENGWIFLEIGAAQGAETTKLLRALGFVGVRVTRDFSGRERFVQGQLNAGL